MMTNIYNEKQRFIDVCFCKDCYCFDTTKTQIMGNGLFGLCNNTSSTYYNETIDGNITSCELFSMFNMLT